MALDRTTLRAPPAIQRRPAVSTAVQRSAAEVPRSPGRALQERFGNRATQILIARVIASRTKETGEAQVPVDTTAPPSIQRAEQSSKWTRLPAKVSKANDPAELEAEETARKVMRMNQPASKPTTTPTTQKEIATGTIQRAEATPSGPTASSPRVNIPGGSPLPSSVRSHMEPRFGTNFGNVRVHTGDAAAQHSANLNANAFTVGDHIFFGREKYQPQSASGKELIAHELTHTIQQGAAVQRSVDTAATQSDQPQVQRKAAAPDSAARNEGQRTVSSQVVDISSGVFNPSEKVKDEIQEQRYKGLMVRVIARGLTGEGQVKIKVDSKDKYDSMARGSMPLLNPWAQQLGGMHLNFTVKNNAIAGYASLKPGGGDSNDWLQAVKKNSSLLGGVGLRVENLPTPVNKFESGKLTLGVTNLKVEVGGFLDAKFNVLVENANKPKIDATANVNIKGMAKGTLTLDNSQENLAGQVSLGVDFKAFSGLAVVKYLPDGTVDVCGKAAYNANKLSGEIQFVATDLETANKFAKDAIAAAGGKENVQDAPAPAPVPPAKAGKKSRALAATGQLTFNLTQWFAGTVNVVVDGKGEVTVIGKIAPPAEIPLFGPKPWDKELIKFEAKAYYGIPVVGNLNLFANISLHALATLGPAKIYKIEVLGTYSTDPEIQKNIQISGSINISAYAGLRLRAEGGAGIEILSHDLKFGIGLNADVGVKAYAEARPTFGYRDPGQFYISGTLEMVAQPMLGLGGEFFIELETPWWSPLSDDKWTWPLFSKEWPLSDPIGINASVKDYVLGSGQVPEIELKKPEFDPSKFMTSMVDNKLPNKSGGAGAGSGTFKDDGSVPKPIVPPKKAPPTKPLVKPAKKGPAPAGVKSAKPDPKAQADQVATKALKSALDSLKNKAPYSKPELDKALGDLKAKAKGVSFNSKLEGDKWIVTASGTGKKKSAGRIELAAKGAKGADKSVLAAAQKTFALPKEGHTVSARLKDGGIQVTIASARELEILAMLADARSEVAADTTRNEKQRSEILSDLALARDAVKSMKHDWLSVSKQQQDFEQWAEIRLTQIVNFLSLLGADGIQAFRDFKGKPLDKRYLPTGYDVRNKLYLRGSGVSRTRADVIKTGRQEVENDVRAVINNRTTNPAEADAAWNRLVKGLRVPDGASKMSLTMQHLVNTPYEVDHKDSLSIHWTSHGGNNTKDQQRWDLSVSTNLRYITRTEHDKKPKEPEYAPFVGKNFESVYAQGGQSNAKTIDGQAFLDAPGGTPI